MHRRYRTPGCVLAAAAWGVGVFWVFFSWDPLEIARFGWLLRGDWGQHFLGWYAFAVGDWHLPLGRLDHLAPERPNSVAFTDSLPLLALPLKLAAAGAAPFQFQGPWFLGCLVLQAVIGFLVVWRLSGHRGLGLLGAALLTLLPAMLQRISHDTLFAHWILLGAVGLFLFLRAEVLPFAIAVAAAAAIWVHPYFMGMIAMLLAAALVLAWMAPRPEGASVGGLVAVRLLAPVALFVGLSLASMASIGHFLVPSGGWSGAFGTYSMNLGAFINPLRGTWSYLLEPGAVALGQYEGFNYLGAGWLALVAVAVGVAVYGARPLPAPLLARFRGLLAVGVGAALFALSNRVVLGADTLVEVELPALLERVAAIFRASGRFGWLAALVLLLWALATVTTRLGPRPAALVLAGALAVQMVDLSGAPAAIRARVAPDPERQRTAEEIAAAMPGHIREIALWPLTVSGPVLGEVLYPLAFAAIANDATINTFYFARFDRPVRRAARTALRARIEAGDLAPDTTYLVRHDSPLACTALERPGAGLWARTGDIVFNGDWLDTDPVPPRAGTPLTAAPPPEGDLADLVAGCGEDCTMALAVRDEASHSLPTAARRALAARGAREIRRLGYRQSYLAVLEDGRVIVEKRSARRSVAWAGMVSGRRVCLSSAANGHGNAARIGIDGREVSPDRRGFNGVVIEGARATLAPFHRDTHRPEPR